MRIINIVDNIEQVNFGIWNAATNTSDVLERKHGCQSEIWFENTNRTTKHNFGSCTLTPINNTSLNEIKRLIENKNLKKTDTIIVTHGCWRFATHWGHAFKKLGFAWIYVPHGMLEPWSMKQKKWKKRLYFNLIEKRMSLRADFVRAVGSPEYLNLKKHYSKVALIPNGIPGRGIKTTKTNDKITFLFMARLNHKKGIVPLINAWLKSELAPDNKFELIIAGPDDGELPTIQKTLNANHSTNINYIGAVYGEAKNEILERSNYYILPSLSEGFPVSVLEAMQAGCIPLITQGCNFPEVFTSNLAIEIKPDETNILQNLNLIINFDESEFDRKSNLCRIFINENYTTEIIADKQFELFESILPNL